VRPSLRHILLLNALETTQSKSEYLPRDTSRNTLLETGKKTPTKLTCAIILAEVL
jgi:hypothetical protein